MKMNGMRPIHPGEILSEEFLKPLDLATEALARSLNEPEAEIGDVVSQQVSVSAGLAKKLSTHLNTTPEFWLNLQATYDLREAGIERGRALNT
ncbi:HigA family addiction module antitoxin [Pseudomonas sp. NPDC099000]|uniref:HigA family addiction module antitoxin n=1 Tax=Pseudomonas sp. NPDC099000 TaxID=3364488 RepID=UPI00383AF774